MRPSIFLEKYKNLWIELENKNNCLVVKTGVVFGISSEAAPSSSTQPLSPDTSDTLPRYLTL
jgi:hypothetical protein